MALRREMEKLLEKPIYLEPNTFLHFYNGGKLRAEFMGEENPRDDYRSEEWIFSTNRAITPGRDNPPDKGFSRIKLPNGEVILLKRLLEEFPEETLGRKHFERFGANLGILVKIFDVGEGSHIPVHWHPTPEFSRNHLNSPYGKNESWIVIGTRPGARAWIGWREPVEKEAFRKWMEAQNVQEMRKHLHEVKPKVDDVFYLRAGIVHSIGSGLCILEPQEPTDWNILAEWEGFPYGRDEGNLGLGWDLALESADFSEMDSDYLYNHVMRKPLPERKEGENVELKLLPDEAKRFFWVTRLNIADRMRLSSDRGFFCAVTLKGSGRVSGPFGELPIKRGKSLFVHASVPPFDVINDGREPLDVVCCYPPESP